MSPSTEEIRHYAKTLGWDDVGITKAEIPKEEIEAYVEWIRKKKHGDLTYMENQIRCHPKELFPGAKSALIFVSYYKQEPLPFKKNAGVIASYARGRDYHNVHRKRLKKFIRWFENACGQEGICKGFSDSTPIMEKALAVQAGLGWLGKNTLLIHRRFGTFTLLAGLFTTVELEYEQPIDSRFERCGTCTRCLDACPTQALTPYEIDATKCLSYHTIEMKGDLPKEIAEKNPGYAFGCDICQDVCPHNIRKPLSLEEEFSPSSGIGEYLTKEMAKSFEKKPEKLFGTPLKRRGASGLLANLDTLPNGDTHS